MVLMFCSDYVGAPMGSGLAHLTEHLPVYILASAPKMNPGLMRSSEVITHFSIINTINLILPYISRSFISR